jgi:geranylgeranyl pyrophosphate synthase
MDTHTPKANTGPAASQKEKLRPTAELGKETHDTLLVSYIRNRIQALSLVKAWPEMITLIDRPILSASRPCWEYPLLACRAVGGESATAWPAASAIFCMLQSIHLVDDLLDQDPKGIHHRIGVGRAANLGLAFQATASLMFDCNELPGHRRAWIEESLAHLALSTAYGQDQGCKKDGDETDYWRAVDLKTPPLFVAALFMGAVLGGASQALATTVQDLGNDLGRIVQVNDDLKDAMERPASPDWESRTNNLAILYTLTAEHSEKRRFLELVDRTDEPDALNEAQNILARSGAISYCCYHLLRSYGHCRERVTNLDLQQPMALIELLDGLLRPLKELLCCLGLPLPGELLE